MSNEENTTGFGPEIPEGGYQAPKFLPGDPGYVPQDFEPTQALPVQPGQPMQQGEPTQALPTQPQPTQALPAQPAQPQPGSAPSAPQFGAPSQQAATQQFAQNSAFQPQFQQPQFQNQPGQAFNAYQAAPATTTKKDPILIVSVLALVAALVLVVVGIVLGMSGKDEASDPATSSAPAPTSEPSRSSSPTDEESEDPADSETEDSSDDFFHEEKAEKDGDAYVVHDVAFTVLEVQGQDSDVVKRLQPQDVPDDNSVIAMRVRVENRGSAPIDLIDFMLLARSDEASGIIPIIKTYEGTEYEIDTVAPGETVEYWTLNYYPNDAPTPKLVITDGDFVDYFTDKELVAE